MTKKYFILALILGFVGVGVATWNLIGTSAHIPETAPTAAKTAKSALDIESRPAFQTTLTDSANPSPSRQASAPLAPAFTTVQPASNTPSPQAPPLPQGVASAPARSQTTTCATPSEVPQRTEASSHGSSAIAAIPFAPPSAAPLELDLEPGIPLPVVALPSNTPVSPVVAQTTDAIANAFQSEMTKALANPSATDQSISQAYANAQQNADQNYWVLYGDTAYNQQSIKAQLEAIGLVKP